MSGDVLRLRNMRFYAHHGLFPEENRLGQQFEVDVDLIRDLASAGQTDDVDLTVNYPDCHLPFHRQQFGVPEKPYEADDVTPPPQIGIDTPRLRQHTADYYNCMSRLDTAVGHLLDAPDRIGRLLYLDPLTSHPNVRGGDLATFQPRLEDSRSRFARWFRRWLDLGLDPMLFVQQFLQQTRDIVRDQLPRLAATVLGHGLPVEKLGGPLGFPTANIEPPEGMAIPGDGIYATFAHLGDRRMMAATSIGTKPTFGDHERAIEAFILDFDGDLYGKILRVEFVKHLRGQVKYDTIEALQEQVDRDVEETKAALNEAVVF